MLIEPYFGWNSRAEAFIATYIIVAGLSWCSLFEAKVIWATSIL